jgi:hypothetical protein
MGDVIMCALCEAYTGRLSLAIAIHATTPTIWEIV